MIPLGALVGGVVGDQYGLRPTLAVGALGMLLTTLCVAFSPLYRLRELPSQGE